MEAADRIRIVGHDYHDGGRVELIVPAADIGRVFADRRGIDQAVVVVTGYGWITMIGTPSQVATRLGLKYTEMA